MLCAIRPKQLWMDKIHKDETKYESCQSGEKHRRSLKSKNHLKNTSVTLQKKKSLNVMLE